MKRLLVLLVAMLVICSTAFGGEIDYHGSDFDNIGRLQAADTVFVVIGLDTVLILVDSSGFTIIGSLDNTDGYYFKNKITIGSASIADSGASTRGYVHRSIEDSLDGYLIHTNGILFGNLNVNQFDLTSVNVITLDTIASSAGGNSIYIRGGTAGNIKIEEPAGTLRWTFSNDSIIGEVGAIITGLDHIVFDDGTNKMRESGLDTHQKEYWFPDLFTDTVVFFEVDSSKYPFGITIKNASILTSVAGVYALQMIQFTAADPPVAGNFVDTLNVVAGKTRISSVTFTDATVPRGAFIYINTPDNNIEWIHVKILFYANES